MNRTRFVKELKATRGEQNDYFVNFIVNFSRSAILMHKNVEQFKKSKLVVEEAIRNYIVSIVSCLETFYRDLYIHVLSLDETTLERILPDLKAKTTYSDIHSLLKEGVNFSEIAASEASFQSIEEIDAFMSKLFYPNGYLDVLGSTPLEWMIPSRAMKTTMRLHDKWRSEFAAIFDHRHSLIHDANRRCKIDLDEIRKLETTALLVPQFTTQLIELKQQLIGAIPNYGFPVLFLVEDLISEDWEVAEDNIGLKSTK